MTTPVLLMKIRERLDRDAALVLKAALPQASVDICVAEEGSETYVYCRPAASPANVPAWIEAATQTLRTSHSGGEIALLQILQDVPGAASGQPSGWHYVVETDVQAGVEDDFNGWYSEEHLPGLAAVPGTVHAWRYEREGSPRYHACYDLVSRETFGSPPWVAVRASDWSSRVRPSFRNTKRTMFIKLV